MEAELVELWETRENVGGRWVESRFIHSESPGLNIRELQPTAGWTWHGRWQLDCTLSPVDDHGWQYLQTAESWVSKRKRSKKCRRRWVRLQVRELVAETRPLGTGCYKFQLLTIYENQRLSLSHNRFSPAALKVADHPAFSDAVGGLSPERWMSSGLIGSTRYCAWRSTWQQRTPWEYAESFKIDPDFWTAAQTETSCVRRRQMSQVVQLEIMHVSGSDEGGASGGNGVANAEPPAAGEAAPAVEVDASSEDEDAAAAAAPAEGAHAAAAVGGESDTAAVADGVPALTLADIAIPGALGWEWTDIEVPLGVDAMNAAISHGDSQLLLEMNAFRKVTNFVASEWVGDGVGRTRGVQYVMAKTTMVKATPASEVQTYSVFAPGVAYAVERLQSAPKLPYGSTFQSKIRDVIIATSPTTSRLRSSIELVWSSSPFAKSMIVNGAKKGSKEAFGEMAGFIKKWIAEHRAEFQAAFPPTPWPAAPAVSPAAAASPADSSPPRPSPATSRRASGEGGGAAAAVSPAPALLVSPETPQDRIISGGSIQSRGSARSIRPSTSTVAWADGHGVDVCTACQKTRFGFLSRQHHCRFCGRVVCDSCSLHRKWSEDVGRKERCCDDCVLWMDDGSISRASFGSASAYAGKGSSELPADTRSLQPYPHSEVSSLASLDVSGTGPTTPQRHVLSATLARNGPVSPMATVNFPPPAPASAPGSPNGTAPRPSGAAAVSVSAATGLSAADWKCPLSPMSLNELRKLHGMIDIYTDDSIETLRAVLRACTFEAADLIARIHDIESSPAWDEWCHNPREKEYLVEEWEKAVVLALLIVDDASSRIEYNPATSVDERDDQQKTRAATELFLHTHKTFICRLATTFEIPQFLGVLSLLGEQGLAYKSMWRATIDRAIETQNVEVIADNLQRFKEDERVKTYENNFYEKNVERLTGHLRDERVKELLACMADGDTANAHAAVCHLIREGFTTSNGSVHALLASETYAEAFSTAMDAMASRFIEVAETSAITAMARSAQARQQRQAQARTSTRSSGSKSPLRNRKM